MAALLLFQTGHALSTPVPLPLPYLMLKCFFFSFLNSCKYFHEQKEPGEHALVPGSPKGSQVRVA